MIRRGATVVLLFLTCLVSHSQKIIDTLSGESCRCFEKFLEKAKLPVDDSLTNCITLSIIPHFATLTKEKKLQPGTVEGIREIHKRVRKSLKKNAASLQVNS